MFLRMTIAVVAYVLSSLGILVMFQGILEDLRKSGKPSVVTVVWLIAFLAHAVMTTAWVRNKKLGRFWPVIGTVSGTGSFLVWPALMAKYTGLFGVGVAAASAGTLIAIQIALVFPCVLLAVWIVRFHSKTTKLIPSEPAVINQSAESNPL